MLKLLTLFVLSQAATVPNLTVREESAFWLTDPGVRQTLALTPAQSRTIDAALKAYDDKAMAMMNDPQAADEVIVAGERTLSNSLVADLSESQRRTLYLREIKERGVGALADDEVAKEVGLTGDEAKRVQTAIKAMEERDTDISAELAEIALKLPPAKTPQEQAANDAKMLALAKAAEPREKARALARKKEDADLLAALSEPVRAAWTRLIR